MPADADRLTAARDALLFTLGGPPSGERDAQHVDHSYSATRIPVTLLSGFLGAGKTTLLCDLLEQSAVEIVAIVNDIASINVDAALVRTKNAETIELDNGCACCVLGSDLQETLEEIGGRAEPPDAVVIEASGLSDPMGIAQTVANVESMTLDGIVTVVDALAYRERVADPVTAHLFERQLAAAHLIVLSKTGANLGDEVVTLRGDVGRLAPGRPVLLCDAGETGVEVLLGAATRGARPDAGVLDHAGDGFAVETLTWPGALCAPRFFALLDELPDAVYRVKGWVSLEEPGSDVAPRFELQAAGSRWRVSAQSELDDRNQLVVIGRAGDAAFDDFLRRLRALRTEPSNENG